jgi:uncharacterized protein YndB with AHSA1/START domain
MAKWLVGCLAAVVVVGGALVWFGYRKFREFTSAPPIATVVIQAPPARVFAALADADSMKVWRAVNGLTSSRRGRLQVGDTVHGRIRSVSTRPSNSTVSVDSGYQRSTEIVTALVPDKLLVLSMVSETGAPIMVRRDSLVGFGDSTEVVTTFALPASDSIRARIDTTSASERRILEMSLQLVLSVARVQARMEHRRLKARIDGTMPPTSVEIRDQSPRPPPPPRRPQ